MNPLQPTNTNLTGIGNTLSVASPTQIAGGTPNLTPNVSTAPPVSSTMDASAIQNNTGSLNLAPKTQPPAPPNITGLAPTPGTPPAGWDTTTYANFKAANPTLEPTAEDTLKMQQAGGPTQTPATSLTDKLANLFTSSKNKESDLATQTESATAPYNQQLNEINTQIKTLQATAIQNQEKAARSGETTGFASREEQNVARTDAIQGLLLQAQAEGMRGNISLAETHVTNAINAKYADINKQIEDTKTNIYNNYDSFTAAEKKQADATLLRIDAQDAFVKNAMDNDKTIQGIIQSAIKQGGENGNPVPTLILSQANKLNDATQVTSLLAPYLKNAADIQAKLDAHNLSVANLNKINSETSTASNTSATKDAQGNDVVNPVVASWVANINSGKAKLSDITAADLKKYPNLKNDISIALSQSGGAASTILQTTKDSIKELNDMVNGDTSSAIPGLGSLFSTNTGFRAAVGAKGISSLFGFKSTPIAGTPAANFDAKLKQVINEQVLPNLSILKGLGRVTQTEFNTLQTALTSLNTNLSENAFKTELKNITDRINAVSGSESVKVNGQDFVVGQVYSDAKGNTGIFDKNGKWIPQ